MATTEIPLPVEPLPQGEFPAPAATSELPPAPAFATELPLPFLSQAIIRGREAMGSIVPERRALTAAITAEIGGRLLEVSSALGSVKNQASRLAGFDSR